MWVGGGLLQISLQEGESSVAADGLWKQGLGLGPFSPTHSGAPSSSEGARSRPRTPVAPLDGRLSHPQAAFLHAPATPAPL